MNITFYPLNVFYRLSVLYPLSLLLLALVSQSVSQSVFDPSWSLDYAIEPQETSISGAGALR